jgi:hypothetical protein
LVKINIIDIIAKFYSKNSHSSEANLEICNLLYSMCFKEKDVEVIAHILNAFFDIYSEDDYNYNLLKVGVINTMTEAIGVFREKVNDKIFIL